MSLKSKTEELLDAGADHAVYVKESAEAVATDARDWIEDKATAAKSWLRRNRKLIVGAVFVFGAGAIVATLA